MWKRRKNQKYLVITSGSVTMGVNMTPALAEKLREMSRVPLVTFSAREGLRR